MPPKKASVATHAIAFFLSFLPISALHRMPINPSGLVSFLSIILKYPDGGWKAKVIAA